MKSTQHLHHSDYVEDRPYDPKETSGRLFEKLFLLNSVRTTNGAVTCDVMCDWLIIDVIGPFAV